MWSNAGDLGGFCLFLSSETSEAELLPEKLKKNPKIEAEGYTPKPQKNPT